MCIEEAEAEADEKEVYQEEDEEEIAEEDVELYKERETERENIKRSVITKSKTQLPIHLTVSC